MTGKAIVGMMLVATFAATAMAAPYTGSWTQTWDFNSGLQGWSTYGSAFWNNAGGVGGGGGISTPDSSYAELAGFVLNGRADAKPFVLQADVYVSNHPGYIQDQGIQAYRTGDNKGPQIAGCNAGNMGVTSTDKSWETGLNRSSWVFENATARQQWDKLQIDYGVSVPGKWTAWIQLNGSGWWGTGPVWRVVTSEAIKAVNPDPLPSAFSILRLGAVKTPQYGGGYGDARFDNVKLYVVPEPATMALLGLGGLGLLRRRHA